MFIPKIGSVFQTDYFGKIFLISYVKSMTVHKVISAIMTIHTVDRFIDLF
jgi:hypothetical protein